MRCHVLVHPSMKVLRQSSIKEEEGEREDEEKEEEEEERSRRRGQEVEGRTLSPFPLPGFTTTILPSVPMNLTPLGPSGKWPACFTWLNVLKVYLP